MGKVGRSAELIDKRKKSAVLVKGEQK